MPMVFDAGETLQPLAEGLIVNEPLQPVLVKVTFDVRAQKVRSFIVRQVKVAVDFLVVAAFAAGTMMQISSMMMQSMMEKERLA